MGLVIFDAKAYFFWARQVNREDNPVLKKSMLDNQISALAHVCPEGPIKRRFNFLINPKGTANGISRNA